MTRLPDSEVVHEHSGFYRERFDAAGVAPADVRGIEDLPRLAFLTRADLDAEQHAHSPFGGYTWELMLGRFRRVSFTEPAAPTSPRASPPVMGPTAMSLDTVAVLT